MTRIESLYFTEPDRLSPLLPVWHISSGKWDSQKVLVLNGGNREWCKADLPLTPDKCTKRHDTEGNQLKEGKHVMARSSMKAFPTAHWQSLASGLHKRVAQGPMSVTCLTYRPYFCRI
ncbi:MAG: hypothetical protein DRH15_00850 [Deltaproteobacteria bacterium]|nr:MAG: hypothetical protein DRH15_00850 [Deltaproteobacteria bacterium]